MIKATLIDHMGSDLSVVNAARVSFGKKADNYTPEQNNRLILYLAKHRHISPFAHCFASFHVKAPIFVARQLVKHKFLRINEISRRYVDDEPEFYTPDVWRGRSADKKQGSEGEVNPEYNPQYLDGKIKYAYLQALQMGVAPEQARMILPQSTLTEWYHSGSLDAWADLCNLRCKPDTQYESQLVANQIDTIMSDLYPVAWRALRGES